MDKDKVINKVFMIANNVLCFHDDSDYCTALWEILAEIKPEMFVDDPQPELEYIEEEEDDDTV